MLEEANRPSSGNVAPAPKLSVLAAFRNRELVRVERFLEGFARQTYRDFELIFVDYGSTPGLSAETEKLLKGYPFARYLYNDTRGMPWNRAHALNSGAQASRGEYILCTDVDLVYSHAVLGELAAAAEPKSVLQGGFYLLPRGFGQWERLPAGDVAGLRAGPASSIGAVQLAPREMFFRVRGFDEFYKVWGVEDYDLNRRLEQAGCIVRRLSLSPIYHQWHASASAPEMPAGWLEVMNFRSLTGFARDGGEPLPWGLRLDASLRPSRRVDLRDSAAKRCQLPAWRRSAALPVAYPGLNAWEKILFMREFLGAFAAAKSGEVFVCEVNRSFRIKIWELLSRTVLRHLCRPIGGRRYFEYPREARDVIWYTIALSGLVADYNIVEERTVTRYVLVRK
jgi:glycosyltransferase involved in cell wall biosynthesis